jgi:hypothetical protein
VSSEEKELVQWWDAHVNRPATLDLGQLNRHLDNIYTILNAHVQKLSKVGDWELSEIDVSLDVKGNILMVSLDGAIKLTFNRPKPQ